MASAFSPRAWEEPSLLPVPAPPAPEKRLVSGIPYTTSASGKGRQSVDDPTLGYFSGLTIVAPFAADERWRKLQLDGFSLDRISTADMLELLTEVSPDVSRALWDLLRFCNPGHTLKVMTVGPNPQPHEEGQAFLEAFIAQLSELYGSFNVVLNRLFAGAFLRGCFVAELVLDAAGRAPIDLAIPDGRWIYFQVSIDPLRGPVWVPFQWLYGEQRILDRPTFRYVPVDPLPSKPTGRALCSPAIFTCLFVIGLLHDLRRVVAQQGYPRLDIEISLENLVKTMPADLMGDTEAIRAWLASCVADVGRAFSNLAPDDTFVHTDESKLNRPVGTLDNSSLGAVDGLMRALDRQLTRALKTTPFLMGSNEAVSETHANRSFEAHMLGIESLQQLAEDLLNHMFDLALQAAGIPAVCCFEFDIVRRSEELRDEQVKALKLSNASLGYALGYLSQDEASKLAVDKDKADQEEPRISGAGITGGGGGGGPNPAAVEPQPGVNRVRDLELALAGNGNGASHD